MTFDSLPSRLLFHPVEETGIIFISVSGRASPHLTSGKTKKATIKDFTGCLNEHSIKISPQTSSFSCSNITSGSISSPAAQDRSQQSTVTRLYRTTLSSYKQRLIRVTWSKGNPGTGPVFSIALDETNGQPRQKKPAAENISQLLQKKGNRSFVFGNSVIGLCWDVSAAKYGLGLEPVKDFYVVVIVDAELVLWLRDLSKEFMRKFEGTIPVTEYSMVSRREEVLAIGAYTLYSTKARFRDGGRDHEILIRCKGDAQDDKDAELSVCVDKKKVVNVGNLQWNFRGNQTFSIDGADVDILWDIHDRWFCCSSGSTVFMFRTRSALESMLWLEEEFGEGLPGFSLLIQAVKGP